MVRVTWRFFQGEGKKNQMDNSFLYLIMLIGGLLMAVIPSLVFMGIATLFGIQEVAFNLKMTFFLLSITFAFLISFSGFLAIQKVRCGEIKNYGSIAKYAGISSAIQAGVNILITLVPWFKSIILSIVAPDTDPLVKESIGYGYYSFWAMLFGLAIGGNMSAICV
jgi:hypothetical protein